MTLRTLLVHSCLCLIVALGAGSAFAGQSTKSLTLDGILKMHAAAAKHERDASGKKASNLSAFATPASCTIGGGHCSFDSDCCSDNCYSGTCQAGSGGCSIGGSSCHFDSDCCSDNCYSGTCQEGSGKCTDGGGSCHFDSDCCSNNCYSGTCQSACTETGDLCTYDHECCGGNCNSVGRCGAEPTDPRCP